MINNDPDVILQQHQGNLLLSTLAMLAQKLGPSLRFFGLPNFILLRAFIAGWMPLYLVMFNAGPQVEMTPLMN